jgi:hypothetical protein
MLREYDRIHHDLACLPVYHGCYLAFLLLLLACRT